MSNKQVQYFVFIIITVIFTLAVYATQMIPTQIVLTIGALIVVWLIRLMVIDEIKFRAFAKEFWG